MLGYGSSDLAATIMRPLPLLTVAGEGTQDLERHTMHRHFTGCLAVLCSSRLRQGTAKALAVFDIVQAAEIFRVCLPRLDMKIDEDRPLCL